MTPVVVDASVALKWVVTEEGSERAFGLLEELSRGTVELVAPDHLVGEVANGLRKRVAQRVLSAGDACVALDAMAELRLDFVGGSGRWFRTLKAATDRQVTTYDALYVLLALDLETELVTSDVRLVETGRERDLPVRPL